MKELGAYKLGIFLTYAVAHFVFYVYPNFYPLWPPTQLPMLAIDVHAPFLPWTFLIYTSEYLFILLVILFLPREAFNSFARTAFAVLVLCGVFFFLFPTIYPRPAYPEVDNVFIAKAMALIAAADNPTNCFPSQHVALTGIAAYAARVFGRPIAAISWTWALAIFLSTLTTKQHYFYDIIGGVGIMALVIGLEVYLFEKDGWRTLVTKVRVPAK